MLRQDFDPIDLGEAQACIITNNTKNTRQQQYTSLPVTGCQLGLKSHWTASDQGRLAPEHVPREHVSGEAVGIAGACRAAEL